MGEGAYGRGKRRVAAYGIAAQEMGESVTALDVAERLSYIEPLPAPLRALSRKILGTLVRLAFPAVGSRRHSRVRSAAQLKHDTFGRTLPGPRCLLIPAVLLVSALACRSKPSSDGDPAPASARAPVRTPEQAENFRLLSNTMDRIQRHIERDGYEALSVAEKTIHSVWWLEAEVNNGGFDQYFFNSAGNQATDAAAALDRIGAPRMAAIVRQAIAIFPAPGPSRERFTRQQELDRLPSSRRDEFHRLDEAFHAYPDDLERLLAAFAGAQAAELPH